MSVTTAFTITPSNYNGLILSWTNPTGDPWNEQVLVRSSTGAPQTCYGSMGDVASSDGVVIFDQYEGATPSAYVTSYIDSPLRSGRFYYYTLFVFDTNLGAYVSAGSCQGLVLTYFGFDQLLWDLVPDFEQDLDAQFATVEQPMGPKQRFLSLLGYELDWIHSEISSLFLFTDPTLVSGAILPYMAGNLGITYEPELGVSRSRVLVQNAVFLYQNKGTKIGIAAAASAYSGYGCKVTIGKNLAPQLDDGAFDRSVGHWVAANAFTTVGPVVSAASLGVTPPHTTYEPVPQLEAVLGTEGYLPINNENVGQVSASGGPIAITTCTAANAQTLGIPVPQQATPPSLVASIYLRPIPTATPSPYHTFTLQADWYKEDGTYISSTVGAPVAETDWAWERPYTVGSPPAGAYWAGFTLLSTTTVTNITRLIDGFQVEWNTQATPGPTSWEPPRDIKINLFPVRQNLFPNPVAGDGVAGLLIQNGTLQSSLLMATPPAISWPVGTKSGFVVTTEPVYGEVLGSSEYGASIPGAALFGGGAFAGGAGVSLNTTLFGTIPVEGGDAYTFSGWVQAATRAANFYFALTFLNALGVVVSADFEPFVIASPQAVVGSWTQGLVVDALAPTSATQVQWEIVIGSPVSFEQYYLGGLLLEPSPYLNPFFDGSSIPSTDYSWEGTPNDSVSDFYPNLNVRLGRLVTALPLYTPVGSTFSLVTGAPAFVNTGGVG